MSTTLDWQLLSPTALLEASYPGSSLTGADSLAFNTDDWTS
ncbi:hypothetical protein [Ferrimicrobium acidiphilum]|nr:hypothetical protein [Ferrimicrobium acidiphilum]